MAMGNCTNCGYETDDMRVLEVEVTIGSVTEIAGLCPSCVRQLVQDLHSDVENPLEFVGYED